MSMENDSLIGRQLGAYQVQSSLGEGGMARVYKAYHPRLRRDVAIKVILAEIADREGFQARFEREAQVVASLEHPNIVSVYDFGEEGNLTYLVMQYVGGGTLRDQLRGKRPLEPQRAIHYAIQMAQALHHAHQHGVVHRDVKPQNMLISSADPKHLLLSDFGIAKLYQGGEDPILTEMPTSNASVSSLTSIDQIIGTADYMSPEQATGKAVDARTDVYALGVVLYQMLTGEVPFHSTTLQGLLFQHVYTPPPPVRTKNPLVPDILAQITAKALAKAPEDRFQTADAMARALELANINATNPLASLAQSNLTTLVYPQTGMSNLSAQYATNRTTNWPPPTTNPPGQIDNYATVSASQAWTGNSRTTSPGGTVLPNTSSGVTSVPQPIAKKRPLPLSYVLAVMVVIASLIVFGIRFLPGLIGGSAPTTNNEQAQAFDEHFQNNNLNWLVGSDIAPGVNASTPGEGAYTVTISADTTVFSYPQAVGVLPDNFTLTATLQQNSGTSNGVYGIAFHLSGGNSNKVSCYALIVNSSGKYEILEYINSHATTISQGNYQPNATKHTLTVQAQGNNYTFSVDRQAEQITIGANSSSHSWSNSDLHDGQMALLFAGANTEFEATNVQLSIP